MTIEDPVHHHSYHVDEVATCDLLEREPATIVAFSRENPPYNQNPVMELRFFGAFPNLNIWSHIDSLFDVLAHYQAFKTVMLVEARMTLFIMEGLHNEDWEYLSEILSLSNQSWQLYRSRHQHLVSWQEWQASGVLAPRNTYQAWRAHILDPDSGSMAGVRLRPRTPPDGRSMARGRGWNEGSSRGLSSSSSSGTRGRGRARGRGREL